jgi:undecaprenyl-diphosphatase
LPHVLGSQTPPAALAAGLLAAAVSGYASIAWLLRFLRSRSAMPFVVYRVVVGVALFGVTATGLLPAR